MQSLSSVVDAQLDAQAAFNLVLCTFALGDKEMMKQAFTRLIEVGTTCSIQLQIFVSCSSEAPLAILKP